jgi:hypothetical protein
MALEKSLPAALCVALVALAASLVAEPSSGAPWELLDQRQDGFREGRRELAALDTRLLRRGGRTHLTVALSATGPLVDSTPGVEGVRGANLRTARELDRLARTGGLSVRVHGGTPEPAAGRWHPRQRGTLPLRRLQADGSLHPARSEELLLAVVAESGALPDGRHVLEIQANGVPRLFVTVDVEGPAGRILEVTNPQPHDEPEVDP